MIVKLEQYFLLRWAGRCLAQVPSFLLPPKRRVTIYRRTIQRDVHYFATIRSHPTLSNMRAFVACIAVALVACVHAEPPSGYNYNRPSSGGFSGGHGGGGLGGGGGYRAVSSGYQTSEGQNVDQALLEQVRQILLKEESQSSSGGFGGGHGGAPSSSYGAPAPSSAYGAPSSSYGAPSYSSRVVGIDLEGVRQALQVAQFEQSSGSSGGYPSGPSSSYGAPARAPSSSYGAPSGPY